MAFPLARARFERPFSLSRVRQLQGDIHIEGELRRKHGEAVARLDETVEERLSVVQQQHSSPVYGYSRLGQQLGRSHRMTYLDLGLSGLELRA
jgi:hypothetical protein